MTTDAPIADHPSHIPDPAGWPWIRFIIDHNPCFLLSALCMFLGCYLLNSAMDVRAADVGKTLILLATINVYEFALIALGFALLGKPGGRGRDGVLLLIVQLLFLADGPFLIAQLMQASAWNWLIALAFGALALFKAALVLRGTRIPFCGRTHGFLALQLLLIYGLPLLLSHIAPNGELSANALYIVWWIVGLLPAGYEILARFEPYSPRTGRQEFLRKAYVIIPWLLLIAHVAFFHYIYRATFYVADLSPVLLGLAVATRRLTPTALYPARQLRFLRSAMPVIALFLSLSGPEHMLNWTLASTSISPAFFTAAVAMVVYGYFWSLPAAAAAIAAVILMAIGRFLSGQILACLRTLFDASDKAVSFSVNLVPTSPAAWGVLALIAGFLFLGLGALWSLRPHHEQPPPA